MNLVDKLVRFRLRLGRGRGYFSEIQSLALILISLKAIGLSLILSIPFSILTVILFYIVGYFDQKHGIWLRESEIGTREVNPFFAKIEKKVDEILKNGTKKQ